MKKIFGENFFKKKF